MSSTSLPPLKQRRLESRTTSEEPTPELLETPDNDPSRFERLERELADAKASIVGLENICRRFLIEHKLREQEERERENTAWTIERVRCHIVWQNSLYAD